MAEPEPVPKPLPSALDVFADPALMADPYPLYRRVITEQPVQDVGALMLTRYADVAAALRHPGLSVDDRHNDMQHRMAAAGELTPEVVAMTERRSLLHRDPPDHTRVRAVVDAVLGRLRWGELRATVQRLVDDVIDAVAPRGQIELIDELAFPVPLTVVCGLLGVPPGDHVGQPWTRSQLCADFEGPPVAAEDCVDYTRSTQDLMTEYFDAVIAERRRHPGDDVVSALLQAEGRGELSTAEVNDTCRVLLVAASETTTDLIAGGMLALLRHPEQLRALSTRPELAAGAVEEVLRYDPPVQFTRRTARADVDLGAVRVTRGELVLLWLGATGHDPERFSAGARFDITRTGNAHLQFGAGAHACPGAALARLQGEVALTTLCRRLVEPRLVSDPPRYMPRAIHAIEQLPVAFRGVTPRSPREGS